MRVSLIAAVSANGVIGVDGALPWHLPDDFRWFKAQTLGKPVLMGRKTWESLPRALPGRQNIVLTRDAGYVADGANVVNTPAAAVAAAGPVPELVVIGGEEVFRLFLDDADRIYLTRVAAEVAGDAFFPDIAPEHWRQVSSAPHAADERHAHAFDLQVYDRVGRASSSS